MHEQQKLHRIFIGCDVSEEFRTTADTVIHHLQKKLAKKYPIQWMALLKLHFTIRFIGHVEESKIDVILNAIEQVVKNHAAFDLELTNIDFFPKNRPHVLAINLRLTEELAILYANLNKVLKECDIEKDNRVFLPHITLARFHNIQVADESFAKEFNLLPKKFSVNEIYLYESNQQDKEEYKKLKKFLLGQ